MRRAIVADVEWGRTSCLEALRDVDLGGSGPIRSAHGEGHEDGQRDDDGSDGVHDDALVRPLGVFKAENVFK